VQSAEFYGCNRFGKCAYGLLTKSIAAGRLPQRFLYIFIIG